MAAQWQQISDKYPIVVYKNAKNSSYAFKVVNLKLRTVSYHTRANKLIQTFNLK